MPKLSDTMTEGTLLKWHKNVGDRVEIGDIIAEGMPGTAMPPWSRALSPEEQRAVYATVQRMRGQTGVTDFLR
jgi:mono/diheme cytochrome c family protein